MKIRTSIAACAALMLAAGAAFAQAVEYAREGGTGTLHISPAAGGLRKFGFSTFGANGHTCELGGTIKGNTGTADDGEPGQPACRITFAQKGDTVEVTPGEDANCQSYCGARGSFHGKYRIAPAACKPAGAKAAKDSFLALYKAKDFQKAYDKLNAWHQECKELLYWMESDSTLNDLALAQHHMKQPAACLKTLAGTTAAELKTMKALEEELAPLDYETYAPTARATFFNMKLCKSK